MSLTSEIKISIVNTVIAALGFVVVIVQLSIALSQLDVAEKNQRAQYLSGLHERAFSSDEIRDIFQKIEYNELVYDTDFHKTEDQENLVALLSFFELLGELEKLGMIDMSDIAGIFGYYLGRTYKSQPVRKYLSILRETDRLGFYQFERLSLSIVADAPRIE